MRLYNQSLLKNNIKIFIIIFIICMKGSFVVSAEKDRSDYEEYESATEYDYPPFSVTDNGIADGFSVDLLKAVAEEVGIKINFKVDEWAVIKTELENGELDLLPLVGISEDREDIFDFTIPYIVMRGNIFLRVGNDIIKSEADLMGKSVIVMEGDNSEEYARSIGLSDTLVLTSTYTEAFKLLSSGQYDAVLAQGLIGEKIINDLNLNNIEALYTYDNDGETRVKVHLTGYEQKFCFAVTEGNKDLLAKLNEGLAVVSENGVYDELYSKWFPFLINDQPSGWQVAKYLGLLLIPIVFIFLLVSFYTVRNQVKSKTKELRVASLQLTFERNKYYSTLVAIGEGVLVVNHQGMIEIINPIAKNMFGVSIEESIDKHYSEIIKLKTTLNESLYVDPIQKVFENKTAYSSNGEILYVLSQNQKIFLEVKATVIKDSNDEIINIVVVFTDISSIKDSISQIEYLSYHDSLTGLYNRRFFEEEMKRLDMSRSYPLTVMMADVNGLKLVNDAFGHLAGDDMLKKAAQIMEQECRKGEIVARWGGDEFVILFPNTDSEDASHIVARIKKACEETDYHFGILSLAFGYQTKNNSEESIEEVFKKAEEFMYKEKVTEMKGKRGEIIRIILNTLFEKSPLVKEHCERVSKLGVELGEKLNLHPSEISDIKSIGLLHDIGKIIISREILDKLDKLTKEEYDEIKKHAFTGYKMLKTSSEFSKVAEGVLQHHERIDGTGYPEGLLGVEISVKAKIIAIVDAYDAMTQYRPYKKTILSKEEAKVELLNNIGTQFDEDITKVFITEVLKMSL